MVRIEEPGRALSEDDVVALEQRIGCRLPESYRRFLLENNGGRPTPDMDTIDIENLPESPTGVDVFFGIDDAVECCTIEWNLRTLDGRISKELLPIARDGFGNRFCISLSKRDFGSVVYCDFYHGLGFHVADSALYYTVAPDFDGFLERIRSLEDN